MRRVLVALVCCLPVLALAADGGESRQSMCAPSGEDVRVIEADLDGVPALVRIPPEVRMPPIVLWHGFGPPDSEAALMSLLPLDEVPAVKVYAGLPLFGRRALDDPGALAKRQSEDLATGVYQPVVMGAAHELPRVAAALRREGCLAEGQAIGLFGFSAGGAAALYALAEREVPVAVGVVLNASIGLGASVAAYERATGSTYAWTPESRALAARTDAAKRAADIAAGSPPPAVLVVHGARDAMIADEGVRALHEALVPHYAGAQACRLRLEMVADLPHAMQTEDDVAAVRERVGHWFLRFMPQAGDGPGCAHG